MECKHTGNMCTHTQNFHSLSCENLDKLYVSLCTVSLSSADPALCHFSTSFSSSFVPSSFHLPHLHLFCPLLLYLLLLCSSTCPSRVHLSDPVTLAAGRQIASTPTGLSITLLSPSVDQIALTVYQQTRQDSRLHSHEHTHINNTQTEQIIASSSLLYLIRFNSCIITLLMLWHANFLAVPCSYLRLIEALDLMAQIIFVSFFTCTVMQTVAVSFKMNLRGIISSLTFICSNHNNTVDVSVCL